MKQGFRQSMAWLHTWTGLVLGWLLLAIFVTGTLAVFRPEISHWMRPDQPTAAVDQFEAIAAADRYLRRHADGAKRWFINVPEARETALPLYWEAADGSWHDVLLDPGSGQLVKQRATLGGEFFYRFHFELQMPYPWGRWLACFAAMVMLVALVSGIVTHRRFFKDFFTFRPKKAAQRSWLDAHNALGVLALPFHLVMTYSGLVTLLSMTMPAAINALYDGDATAFYAEQGLEPAAPTAAGITRPLQPLAPLARSAIEHWQGGPIGDVTVTAPGDANARVTVFRADSGQLQMRGAGVVFDGVNGKVQQVLATPGPATLTHDVIYGLHIARFADYPTRWLYFLSGLVGSLMIATGLVLWSIKRQQRDTKAGKAGFGTRCVVVLNIATVAGLPLAIAAFFWGNRLLPLARPERAGEEVLCFFIVWAMALTHAALRPARAAWREQLGLGALAFALLPLLSAITTPQSLPASLRQGDWTYAGFELTALGAAAALAWAAWKVHRADQALPVPRPTRKPAASAQLVEDTP